MTLLVTGFGRYGDVERNPSELIARELDGESVGGHEVAGRVLPVSAASIATRVREALAETEPTAVVLLGVAPGRPQLTIERLAVNVFDFENPDNDGAQPVDVPIVDDGPAAYFARLPLRAIVAAWNEAGIPGAISDTAGTYLCNAAMYAALHETAERAVPAGFVHLPSLPEQVATRREPQPSMPLATQLEGIRIALAAAVPARV